MSVEFTTTINVCIQVDGSYSPETPAYYSHGFGNWLPGDPEEVTARVYLQLGTGREPLAKRLAAFDIFPLLPEDVQASLLEEVKNFSIAEEA
jgi:hypothetical protein